MTQNTSAPSGHNSGGDARLLADLLAPNAVRIRLEEETARLRKRGEGISQSLQSYIQDHSLGDGSVWIIDDDDYGIATEILAVVQAFAGFERDGAPVGKCVLEDRRVAMKQPTFKAMKQIDEYFRQLQAPMLAQARPLRQAMTRYATGRAETAEPESEAAQVSDAGMNNSAPLAEEAESLVLPPYRPAGQADEQRSAASTRPPAPAARAADNRAAARPPVADRAPPAKPSTASALMVVRVTEIRALARAVADGTVPADFLVPNFDALHAAVRRTENPLTEIPGVEILK